MSRFTLVADLKLKGRSGTRGLMFVPYYARAPRAFIANYRSWREYHNQGKIAEVASSLLSHESLHLTINKFSLCASERLDNLFGQSNCWEAYRHGLGDLDEFDRGIQNIRRRKEARKAHSQGKRRTGRRA